MTSALRLLIALRRCSGALRHAIGFAAFVGVTLGTLQARAQTAAPARPLSIFAAASLQTALTAAAAKWRREGGGATSFSFAGSAALARQIEQGAPVDILATADLDWMDWAQGRGLIRAGTRRMLLGNELVLVEPADRTTEIAVAPGFALAQALGDSRLAMGDPASVPAGRYGRAALTALGVWPQVAGRIAGAENVRAALALVARGEARFGIVYRTDALGEPRVRVVGAFPAGSHPPILYPFAVVAASTHPQAEAFLAWLATPAAARIFAGEGFTVPR